MGNCPMHHTRVTNAANKISEACLELEDAVSYDSSYRPLLDAACRLSKRVRARWMKNCKIGSMSEYETKTKTALTGKTVKSADVNGHGITVVFTDGTVFDYEATDGGYSCWSVKKNGRSIL